MTSNRSPRAIWTIPALLAVVTLVGLVAALVGEGGVWWPLSWAMLAVPCACSVLYLVRGLLPPHDGAAGHALRAPCAKPPSEGC
jgi:hypothetical protein